MALEIPRSKQEPRDAPSLVVVEMSTSRRWNVCSHGGTVWQLVKLIMYMRKPMV